MAGHLCFGSFLKILTLCSPRSTTQKFLCGTMFLAVNSMYDIREDDGTVGHLVNCSNNISPAITDEIAPEHAPSVLACFETQIIPKLYPEKRKHIVHALLDLLFQDDDIADDVRIGTITSNTKGYYRFEYRYNLAEMLTDFFFFVVRTIDNKAGRTYIQDVSREYISSFNQDELNRLVLLESGAATGLTMSVRGKGFEDAFVPVCQIPLGLRNPEDYQIFRLKIEDNKFTYAGLKKYLNTNIGRYVYSRAEMERYKAEGDLESVGMDAAQYIREHSTGNELADMLLYAFLEEVLKAPKLLSSIELGASTNCAGIHLHSIGQDTSEYQMVYGSSQMEGDLKSAIDAAFDAVKSKADYRRGTGQQRCFWEERGCSDGACGQGYTDSNEAGAGTARNCIWPVSWLFSWIKSRGLFRDRVHRRSCCKNGKCNHRECGIYFSEDYGPPSWDAFVLYLRSAVQQRAPR